MEAIKLLVDPAGRRLRSLTGQLLVIDAHDWHQQRLRIPRRADCRVCGVPAERITLESVPVACGDTVPKLSAADCRALTRPGFIDCREPGEWAAGHIPGAHNIPLSHLHTDAALDLPGDGPWIVYCSHGMRSEEAGRLLRARGLQSLWQLEGGLRRWSGRLETVSRAGRQ